MRNPLNTIKDLLRCDPANDDFVVVEGAVRKASALNKKRLLELCQHGLNSPELAGVDSIRRGCAKISVALLPQSRDVIEALITSKNSNAFNVQFTLFCFLEEVPIYPRLMPFSPFVLSSVETYLRSVSKRKALAATKAGDLLAHWPDIDEGMEALLRAAESARFVAGKRAALGAILSVLTRPDFAPRHRRRVISSLTRIAQDEGRSDVGWLVRGLLSEVRQLSES